MLDTTNQSYLLHDQYKNASNLNARIDLHQRFSTSKTDWHRWVFDRFDLPPGSQILELGSGPGHLWLKNRDRISSSWFLTLSDFSAGMLAEAQQNLHSVGHPFIFRLIDVQSIPFPDNTFDRIIANHMLYHVPNLPQALAEIRRVLKPEGIFYAATNGANHLQEINTLINRAGLVSPDAMSSMTFLLETGAELMSPYFANITIHPYANSLIVPEPDPLFAFICSIRAGKTANPDQLQHLRTLIEQEIAQQGTISITKSTGLFIASGQR